MNNINTTYHMPFTENLPEAIPVSVEESIPVETITVSVEEPIPVVEALPIGIQYKGFSANFKCKDDSFYVVSLSSRWGAKIFNVFVEYTLFPPSIPARNSLLNVGITKWEGSLYFVLEVPLSESETIRKKARLIGMKICDGIPTIVDRDERKYFPLSGKNVWTLENRERPHQYLPPFISEEQEITNIQNGIDPIPFLKLKIDEIAAAQKNEAKPI